MHEFAARQRRIYRAQSANFLASLQLENRDSKLALIDWPALESVPHWCFFSTDEQRILRRLCGAVFLAPQMHTWIDGKLIQSVRQLIGPVAYDMVLRQTNPLEKNLSIDLDSQLMESILESAGNAVLHGAISHPQVKSIIIENDREPATDTGNALSVPELAALVAQPLYQQALEIYLQLRQANEAPEVLQESRESL